MTMSSHEPDYLSRREAQERAAAEQSADPSARRAHEQLAHHYAERLRGTASAAV
jgi:hypothetical protein